MPEEKKAFLSTLYRGNPIYYAEWKKRKRQKKLPSDMEYFRGNATPTIPPADEFKKFNEQMAV